MKNIGIKTKKFVRKITAIASAALMTGLSMGAAAADLSALTSTFITAGEFKAYVVVGTGGASNVAGFAKDVAGSVVVASAFAQQAKTSTSTSGSATLARNLTTGYLGTGGVINVTENSVAKTWVNADTGFSWIANTTVLNSTGRDVANVTGALSVTPSGIQLDSTGKYIMYSSAINYTLVFNNDKSTTANIGIGKNNTQGIPFPDGKSYQITNYTINGTGKGAINVSLGQYNNLNTTTGTVNTVGNNIAKFVVMDVRSVPSSKLKVKVLSATDSVLFEDWVSESDTVYSNSDFSLILKSYSLSSLTNTLTASFDWSTSSLKVVNDEINSKWPNWTVKLTNLTDSTTGQISSISWVYTTPSSVPISISQGSELSMFDGFFKVVAEPMVINSSDKKTSAITIKTALDSNPDVYFVDENGTTRYTDLNLRGDTFTTNDNYTILNQWVGGLSWKIQCIDAATDVINVSVQGGSKTPVTTTNGSPFVLNSTSGLDGFILRANVTYGGPNNCNGASFNVSVLSFTSDAGYPLGNKLVYNLTGEGTGSTWGNVSSGALNGTLVLTENATNAVTTLTYKGGNFDAMTSGSYTIPTSGTYYTKDFGTQIDRGSSQIVIVYPEARRVGKISLGQSGERTFELTAGSYNSDLDVTLKSSAGSSEAVKPIDVGLAMLDSEVTTSTLDRPIVLVGGPAVNTLVKTLVDGSMVNMSALSSNRALVQLVTSAFNSQSALVIAGWAGEDTRLAAQVVASQVLGKLSILSGSSQILNTGVTSYTDVTVV